MATAARILPVNPKGEDKPYLWQVQIKKYLFGLIPYWSDYKITSTEEEAKEVLVELIEKFYPNEK